MLCRIFNLRAGRAVVRRTENPRVGGSIPPLATIFPVALRGIARSGSGNPVVHVLVTLRRPIGRPSRHKLGVPATSTGGRQR